MKWNHCLHVYIMKHCLHVINTLFTCYKHLLDHSEALASVSFIVYFVRKASSFAWHYLFVSLGFCLQTTVGRLTRCHVDRRITTNVTLGPSVVMESGTAPTLVLMRLDVVSGSPTHPLSSTPMTSLCFVVVVVAFCCCCCCWHFMKKNRGHIEWSVSGRRLASRVRRGKKR